MYLAAHNCPYYPAVTECGTLDEAVRLRDEILAERAHDETFGFHVAKVYICEVLGEPVVFTALY